MKELLVNLKNGSYSIVISDKFHSIPNSKYGKETFVEVLTYVLESGEENKSVEKEENIYTFLIQKNYQR